MDSAVGPGREQWPAKPEDVRKNPLPLPYFGKRWALGGRGRGYWASQNTQDGAHVDIKRGERRSGTWEIRPLVAMGDESLAGIQRSDTC